MFYKLFCKHNLVLLAFQKIFFNGRINRVILMKRREVIQKTILDIGFVRKKKFCDTKSYYLQQK
jgi:hypothetical protein